MLYESGMYKPVSNSFRCALRKKFKMFFLKLLTERFSRVNMQNEYSVYTENVNFYRFLIFLFLVL